MQVVERAPAAQASQDDLGRVEAGPEEVFEALGGMTSGAVDDLEGRPGVAAPAFTNLAMG